MHFNILSFAYFGLVKDILVAANKTAWLAVASISESKETIATVKLVIVSSCNTIMAAEGTKQLIISIACQDKPCTVMSAIGVCSDLVGFSSNYIPGTKYVQCFTMPLSAGCKYFVRTCKDPNMPWSRLC